MFKVEAHAVSICTCVISDDDEKRIKEYIENNPEEFEFMSEQKKILKAVDDLEIDIYINYTERDFYTDEICWSCMEESSAEEILKR